MKKMITTVVASSLLLSATAFAAVRVGIIDLPQILQNSSQVQAIKEKLTNEFKPQQEKIIKLQDKIRSQARELAPNKSENLKPDQKKAIREKIAVEQKKLQSMVMSFQQRLDKAQEKEMKSFMEQVDSAVKNVAQKDKLDMVLLKPAVVYANDTTDVTKQVLSALPRR